MLERRSDEEFLDILAETAVKVKADYAVRARETPFTPEEIDSFGWTGIFVALEETR